MKPSSFLFGLALLLVCRVALPAATETAPVPPKPEFRFGVDAIAGAWLTESRPTAPSMMIDLHADGTWDIFVITGDIAKPTQVERNSHGGLWELIGRPRSRWNQMERQSSELSHAADAGDPGAGWILKMNVEPGQPAPEWMILHASRDEIVFWAWVRNASVKRTFKPLTLEQTQALESAAQP
jgi:hypothetical protein